MKYRGKHKKITNRGSLIIDLTATCLKLDIVTLSMKKKKNIEKKKTINAGIISLSSFKIRSLVKSSLTDFNLYI
ncbi:MAG: hypothetical protein AB2L12_10790 [Smithellaceae bacterium]